MVDFVLKYRKVRETEWRVARTTFASEALARKTGRELIERKEAFQCRVYAHNGVLVAKIGDKGGARGGVQKPEKRVGGSHIVRPGAGRRRDVEDDGTLTEMEGYGFVRFIYHLKTTVWDGPVKRNVTSNDRDEFVRFAERKRARVKVVDRADHEHIGRKGVVTSIGTRIAFCIDALDETHEQLAHFTARGTKDEIVRFVHADCPTFVQVVARGSAPDSACARPAYKQMVREQKMGLTALAESRLSDDDMMEEERKQREREDKGGEPRRVFDVNPVTFSNNGTCRLSRAELTALPTKPRVKRGKRVREPGAHGLSEGERNPLPMLKKDPTTVVREEVLENGIKVQATRLMSERELVLLREVRNAEKMHGVLSRGLVKVDWTTGDMVGTIPADATPEQLLLLATIGRCDFTRTSGVIAPPLVLPPSRDKERRDNVRAMVGNAVPADDTRDDAIAEQERVKRQADSAREYIAQMKKESGMKEQ